MTVTNIADEATDGFESVANNPELAAAAARIASGAGDKPAPVLQDPIDGPVNLPAGFQRIVVEHGVDTRFEEVRKAWVRELDGEAEERIAKARMKSDVNEFINAVLVSGVEKLGDNTPTREDLSSLTLGDRDYLLLEIARATYGDKLEFEDVTCPECGDEFSVALSLSEDVPIKRLASLSERTFEVVLRKGRVAEVTLPTGEIATEINNADTPAETNTILITHSVREVRGPQGTIPVQGDRSAALRLGAADRQTLITEMSTHMPGPQYNEVKFKHEPGCGKEIHLRITLVDLFRGM